MRSVPVLAAAVIIGTSAMTAACGQQQAGPPAGGSSPSPSGSVAVSANCTGTAPASPARRVVTLSASDNGKSFCVRQGTGVLIYLKGTPAVRWTQLRSSSAALVPRANGHLMLMLGTTGGYFVAIRQGVAVITSSRSPCGPRIPPTPTAHAAPGRMHCGAIESFRVTVQVIP